MLKIFAGPIFEEWYWGPIFLSIFVVPVIILLSFLMIVSYISIIRRKGIKLSKRKTTIFNIVAVIVSIPLSFLIVRYGLFAYAAHNDAKYYTEKKQFTINRLQSKDGKTLRTYDFELTTINSECQKPEVDSIDKKTKFAWHLNVQSAEGNPLTLIAIHSLQEAIVVCPNASIERQGKRVDISSIDTGTDLIVTYERLSVGGRYDNVVRAIKVID